MNICELLLDIENDYNGHKQTIIKGLTTKQGMSLCKKLEKYTGERYSFVLELYVDGSFTILQKDYFKDHILGHYFESKKKQKESFPHQIEQPKPKIDLSRFEAAVKYTE